MKKLIALIVALGYWSAGVAADITGGGVGPVMQKRTLIWFVSDKFGNAGEYDNLSRVTLPYTGQSTRARIHGVDGHFQVVDTASASWTAKKQGAVGPEATTVTLNASNPRAVTLTVSDAVFNKNMLYASYGAQPQEFPYFKEALTEGTAPGDAHMLIGDKTFEELGIKQSQDGSGNTVYTIPLEGTFLPQ